MKAAELYDVDFAEWARQNAELLRSGRVAEADLAHIAEEASLATKRSRKDFPTECPYTFEQLLDEQFLPSAS
jgi:uncharacterized protein DUF29